MNSTRPVVAGVDIDGVVADPTHRLHYLEHRPKNWRGFFSHAHLDPPLPAGLAAVADLAAEGLAIVYVTGRPARLRRDTQQWLDVHGLPAGPLHLRPPRDFRPAPALKVEIYRKLADTHDIRTILDDDVLVVAALKSAGFPVTLADWYRPPTSERDALTKAQDERGRT
jgi:uncharacterized HAD superfamily protein